MGRLLTLLRRRGGGGATPPFTPTNWWDALDDASFDVGVGDLVGSWTDRVGGVAATASGAARPARGADRLTFSGAQYLDAAIGVRSDPETIYMIVRWSGSLVDSYVALDSIDVLYRRCIYSANGQPYVSMYTTARVSNALYGINTLVTLCAVFNGASSVLRISNTEQSGNAGTGSGTGLRIGAGGSLVPSLFITGEVRTILRFAGIAHDATQRAAMVAWAAAYYGITL